MPAKLSGFWGVVQSFNPFHCIPEHLPLGSINRARIKAYESSTAYRHHMNAQPRREPRDIKETAPNSPVWGCFMLAHWMAQRPCYQASFCPKRTKDCC
jgi:hypothetical protein